MTGELNAATTPNAPLMERRLMVSFDDSLRVEGPIEAELDGIVQHGFNTVVFCLTETDLQQRAASRPNKSVLVTMQQMAKERGMYVGVDPWSMGNIFGGEAVSGISRTLPASNAGSVKHKADPFGSPFNKSWHRFLDVAARGGADFVFLDEPQLGRRYSQQSLVEFMDLRTSEAHEHSLRTDVCVTVNRLDRLGQRIVKLACVDGLSTDPIYSGGEYMFSNVPGTNNDAVETFVGGNAQKARALAEAVCKRAGVWIQGHSISAGDEEAIIRQGVLEAAQHVPSVGLWRTHYSNIRPANSALVWKIAGEVFGSLGV